MGFLERIFKRPASGNRVETTLSDNRHLALSDPRARGAAGQPGPRARIGHTSVKVAGESYYQQALIAITGRRGTEEFAIDDVPLELVCEPENPHDPHAVRVEIEGRQVGYLSRGNARLYHRRIKREGGRVRLTGYIGAHEGKPIGVRVKIPDDHPLQVPIKARDAKAASG